MMIGTNLRGSRILPRALYTMCVHVRVRVCMYKYICLDLYQYLYIDIYLYLYTNK